MLRESALLRAERTLLPERNALLPGYLVVLWSERLLSSAESRLLRRNRRRMLPGREHLLRRGMLRTGRILLPGWRFLLCIGRGMLCRRLLCRRPHGRRDRSLLRQYLLRGTAYLL